MKKHLIAIALSGLVSLNFSTISFASLDSDLSGLDAAYQQQERARAKAIARRNAAIKAKKARDYAEKIADKRRDQAYEDKLRERQVIAIDQDIEARKASLVKTEQLKAQKLELEIMRMKQEMATKEALDKAKLQRANEFIDAELASKKAYTDKIQSNADAIRMDAKGKKALNEKLGEAAVKAESGIFK